MNINDTKEKLKDFGFTLSYSGFEGMIMDNHELKLRVIIYRDWKYLKFTKDYDLCDKPLKCNYQVNRDFLLETIFNPIECINEKIEYEFKKATLQA